MSPRIKAGLLTLAIISLVIVACKFGPQATKASAQQEAADTDSPVAMPANLTGVFMTLGLKDQDPTDWDGEITVSTGKILAVDVAQGNPKAKVQGGKFIIKTTIAKKDQKKDAVTRPMLRITLDAPPTAIIKVATKRGDFEFKLGDLADKPQHFLKDQVSLVREDGAMRLTRGGVENDYPALARAQDGTLWLAYCEYHKGKPYLAERVLAGDFDALVPQGHGDQIRLKYYAGNTWSSAIDVTGPGLDIWRPVVTVAAGRVHISWSQQVNGNWDIYHRVYTPPAKAGDKGQWSDIARVSTEPGTDCQVVSTTAANGQVWLAWQAWRKGNFQIVARKLGFIDKENKVNLSAPEVALTTAPANHWSPAIAANSTGTVWVAYDTYARGNYDVRVAEIAGAAIKTHDIAASARFEARPSIVCDKKDRLWIAYEEGDEQWGKDYASAMFKKIGFEGNPGNALYIKRTVRVRCLEGGKLLEPTDLQAALARATVNNKSVPRLGLDLDGGLWLLYRHHPRPFGNGEVWNSFATRYNGQQWSTPRRLGNSDNLMDNRPALAPFGQGVMVVFSGDGRPNQLNRKQNNLFATLLTGSESIRPPELVFANAQLPEAALADVHPNETKDVGRMRGYLVEYQGKKLRLLRGEFHRHTEYTAHRDGDGLLEDSWRYALDAGDLDWMGNADHDNGHHDEYSWWQIQKMADLMHHAPAFVAAQSYERSVKYPNGHRNVIFPKRGIRPLPRGNLEGTQDKGTPDTKILYRYLKHFGGMCASHTSATDMGTDWRDNDPIYEPVVEIYQGHRHNYEFFGAPRSATEKTQIGGYEPKGFVNHALDKGYKLGFQASSDHVSTHMSYAVVLTDDVSRQGIIDAFKLRHCYAATDNIIVEFRSGKYMMGDIFETDKLPTFDIVILGTAPVSKVSIIRDGKYLHVAEPKKQEVNLTFTDMTAVVGKSSYYYVRVEQSDGNLAWASPMWITHKAK